MTLKIEGDSFSIFPPENQAFLHARNFERYMFSEHTVTTNEKILILIQNKELNQISLQIEAWGTMGYMIQDAWTVPSGVPPFLIPNTDPTRASSMGYDHTKLPLTEGYPDDSFTIS